MILHSLARHNSWVHDPTWNWSIMEDYVCWDIGRSISLFSTRDDIQYIALTYPNLHVPLRVVVAKDHPEHLDYLDQLLLLQ
jgi:hypothetical protein